MNNELQFEAFVEAVNELALDDKAVKATSHTAAVSVTDWSRVKTDAVAESR